ncbi:MAG: replicative DNA helicase [Bacteroidota bacterium]|nr:replicative DNA helicase [Bacteroidota bacterium]
MKNQISQLLYSEVVPEYINDAEKAVLGAALCDINAFSDIDSVLSSEMFSKKTYQSIFRALKQLHDERKSMDFITVFNQLKANQELPPNANITILTELSINVHSSLHILAHAEIIQDAYYRRKLKQFGNNVMIQADDYTNDPTDLTHQIIDSAQEMFNAFQRTSTIRSIGEIMPDVVMDIKNRCANIKTGQLSGINTGLTELDAITNGWQKSNVIVLAGRPGMGKTALMLNFARTAAHCGKNVLIYSLEMSSISLVERLICKEISVDPNNYRNGNLTVDELERIGSAMKRLKELPIYIDDKPVVSMGYIRNHAKRMKRNNKCDMIFIDYLQLADMKGEANRNREQEVAQASRMAKIIAKELNIPVMLLSQLSREVEKRGNQEPKLSDLRESGAIEQDADIVMFVYRPSKAGIEFDGSGRDMKGLGKIYIEKHRNGPTGVVKFSTNDSLTKIWDYKQA